MEEGTETRVTEEKSSGLGKGTNFEVLVRRLEMRREEREGRREKQKRPEEEERS